MKRIPPGLIVVATGEIIRTVNFASAMARTVAMVQEVSDVMWSIGATVADNLNDGMRELVARPDLDWVWTIGDDHDWPPSLLPVMLQRMYENDLDILVPLCFRRSWPPGFVIYDWEDDEGIKQPTKSETVLEVLASGDFTREVHAAGNAGMLIRRRVIEALEDPWWRNGLKGPERKIISQAGEDVNFCEDAKDKGFRIHASYDLPLGHVSSVQLVPMTVDNTFGMQLMFGTVRGPFYPLAVEATDG